MENLSERLLKAIREAQKALALNEARKALLTPHNGAEAVAGDKYILRTNGPELCLAWIVVRTHPDDNNLVLIVPCDDTGWIGLTDVSISDKEHGGCMVARCGQTLWVDRSVLDNGKWVDHLPQHHQQAIRRKLADWVRGRLEYTPATMEMEDDPYYQDLIEDIEIHCVSCASMHK